MTSSIVTLAVIATMYIMGGPVVSAATPTFDENPTTCPDGFVLTASAKDDPTEIATTNNNSDFGDFDIDDIISELGPCPIEEELAAIQISFPGIDGPLKVNPRESGCKPYTPCPAGWYTAVGFDEQITPVCKPCPSGYFKADASSANGETEDWEAVCLPRTVCPPGSYTKVAVAESRTENPLPTCISCEEGKFMRFISSPYDTNECETHRPCQPGTYRDSVGTSTSNTICPVCPHYHYSDAENQAACTEYSVCPAGKYTTNVWSKTKDLTCTDCPTDTFNAMDFPLGRAAADSLGPCQTPSPISETCTPWSPCYPGTKVAALGTAATDTRCSPCPKGTWYPGSHFGSKCIDLIPCPPGEFQSNTAPEFGGTQNNRCQPCPSDRYKPSVSPGVLAPDPDLCQSQPTCPKGTHTPVAKDSSQMTVEVGTDGCVACSAGQYQPLELPTTTVSACDTITLCEAGTFTSKIGTPESDAECTPCSETTYQPNASLSFNDTEFDCPEPHRAPCEAGAYTSAAATAVSPSTCTSCPSGTYKSAASGTISELEQASTSCTQKPVCGPGEYTSPTQPEDDKTALQNPVCTACATGTFKPGSSANAWGVVAAQSVSTSEICMPHTPCPSGTYTSKAGSATEDATCTNCPSGSFKPFASASTTETDSCHAWVPKPGCCREISNEIDVNGDSVDVSSAADANTVSVQTFPAVPGAAAGTKCEIACENDETCTAVEVEVDLTSDTAAATCEFHTGTINAATRAGNACKKNHFCMIKNAVPSAAKAIDVAQWEAKSGCCREVSELGKFTHNENVIVVNILIPNSVSDAVVACKQECDAMEGCTAVEVRRFSKAKTPYFKCELHTADINSASRSSKSCKQAKCEIKK